MSLIEEYILAAADLGETQRVIRDHPELLEPSYDVQLARLIEGAKASGDPEAADILTGRRQLLDECRRIGISGALLKFEAYVLVRRFIEAPDPASKLLVIEENPQIMDSGQIALAQMIEEAQDHGADDAVRVFEMHLWLLVTSKDEGPRNAFAAAFGSSPQRDR